MSDHDPLSDPLSGSARELAPDADSFADLLQTADRTTHPAPDHPPDQAPDQAPDQDGAEPASTWRRRARRFIPGRGWSRRRRLVTVLSAVLTAIAAVVALFAWYLDTGKPISQLPGLSQEKPPHHLFSIYGTTAPLGVAVTPGGDRIYVAESGGQRLVHVYERSGKEVATLRPPASTGATHIPVYVAVDPLTRDVYVSDRATAAVYVYRHDNTFARTLTPPAGASGWAPLGLAFDAKGRLYVADVRSAGGHRVVVLDRDGRSATASSPTGGLQFPNGITVDSRGDVEVCDSNNARVVVFAPDGKVLGRIISGGDSSLGLPRGAAVDDRHRLYVVDATNHVVRMYRVSDAGPAVPTYIGSFGSEGTAEGTFEFPNGVAADARARVYVTDRENNRVQVWGY